MMDVPGCCGRRPCCDNGLGDICQGVNCIASGVSKGICCGLNMLGSLGCALAQPCAPACPPPRPCCRPRPHPPTCTCRCVCRCERVCDDRRCC
ncbi:MAG: hypothetical protein LBB75_03035 [Oscillospiraceae bacterium]|nr:hypothetical protein [Oscillospiraceae bacterium]